MEESKKVELLLLDNHIELLIGVFRGLSLSSTTESQKEYADRNYNILINMVPIEMLPAIHEQVLFLEQQYELQKMGMSKGVSKLSDGFEQLGEDFQKFKDE